MPRSLNSDFPARLVVTLAIRGYLVALIQIIILSGGQYCAEGPENYHTMRNYYGKLLWIIVGRTWRKLRSQRTTDGPISLGAHRYSRLARKFLKLLPVLLLLLFPSEIIAHRPPAQQWHSDVMILYVNEGRPV